MSLRNEISRNTRVRIVRLSILLGVLLVGTALAFLAFLLPDGPVTKFLYATHKIFPAPEMYGGFHLAFFGATLLLLVGIFALYRRIPAERLDDIVFCAGLVLFVMELYKQLYYHTVLGNGYYNFAILPLQLCSYVLYLYLLLPLLPEGRVKNALYLFAALYQTAGGCVVMGCPLFYYQVSLSVHTMLWHIVMITVVLLRGYGKSYFREVLPAAGVFLGVYAFGMALNVLLAPLSENSVGPLNLFYLSPLEETHNLIIADVRNAIGWFPAVVTYAVLITVVCVNAVWLLGWVTRRIEGITEKRKETERGRKD